MNPEQVNYWAERFAERSMRLARKVAQRMAFPDAEECESLALGQLMKLLGEYDQAATEAKLWSWLYRALRNDLKDFVKRERRRVEYDGIEPDHAIALENQDELEHKLKRLPEHLRAVVGLRLQGWGYKIIGKRLGITSGAARNNFTEAMRIFQNVDDK